MIIQNKKQNIVDEIHGIKVADPYRWLEDANNPEVQEWIKVQNEKVFSSLKDNSKEFQVFSDVLAKNFKTAGFSSPIPVNGKYFYTERAPDEDQAVLYMKNGLDGEPIKLFDPNGKREGNTVSIDYWNESKTGNYIIYGISYGGDEMATLYIKDTTTNKELEEKIIHCRHSSTAWLDDDSGFYYTRNPRPGTVPVNEEHLHAKVYLHKLGNNPDNDELIFGADRPKDDMISLRISPNGKFLAIKISRTWTENEIYIYNTDKKEIKPLIVGVPNIFSVSFLETKVLLYTNYKANNYRVLFANYDELFKPLAEWKELIPEREYLLESFNITKSKILAEYLVNVCSEIVIYNHEGNEIGKIPLPKCSSVVDVTSRRSEEEFFYGVESFSFPKIIYRYNPQTLDYSEYRKIVNPINPDSYEVKQEWFTSKDGTKVPMFIFCKKDICLNGKNPTILYGYGGFSSSEAPSFLRNWVPWLERGGVFAIANIRGGGEFGDAWHKAGIKENKQNSFDDFICGAEYLISQNYTSNEHLGILGGSNGGLLVSAVAVQRPDLFGAVCSRVPLTDMVRFHKFGIAMRWVHEYGNPEIKTELENILKWSPYHNVKEGVKYPNFLFTTANKDTRVDPLHARKMASILQDSNKENNVLIFTETEAGHGPGKPIVKIVEGQALALTFFANNLGLSM